MQKIRWMKKFGAVWLALAVMVSFCGCAGFLPNSETKIKNYEPTSEMEEEQQEEEIISVEWEDALELAADYLKGMTLEEKVGQIFVVNLGQLDLWAE